MVRVMLKCVVLVIVVVVVAGNDEISRLVNTDQGPVRGYKAPDADLFTFYGIPYATAPVGVHKYKVGLKKKRIFS